MMLKLRGAGQPPRLIFTSDSHQLVRGDPGAGPCLLRYDPFRIVPLEEFGAPGPVTLCVRFHPGGELWEQTQTPAPGALQPHLADPSGQNYMLEARIDLPADCQELEGWFSYQGASGATHWDSAEGKNYWLRFPRRDLKIESAEIVGAGGVDRFSLAIASAPEVDDVIVRWRCAQPADYPRQEMRLAPGADEAGAAKQWATPAGGLAVPHGATVIFDLVYGSRGHYVTDDNEGSWYVVPAAA